MKTCYKNNAKHSKLLIFCIKHEKGIVFGLSLIINYNICKLQILNTKRQF